MWVPLADVRWDPALLARSATSIWVPLAGIRWNPVLIFEVPLRVNTRTDVFGHIRHRHVFFDPEVLSVGDPQEAATFNKNTNQIRIGILDAVAGQGFTALFREHWQ